jgi:hypothetical protein
MAGKIPGERRRSWGWGERRARKNEIGKEIQQIVKAEKTTN